MLSKLNLTKDAAPQVRCEGGAEGWTTILDNRGVLMAAENDFENGFVLPGREAQFTEDMTAYFIGAVP